MKPTLDHDVKTWLSAEEYIGAIHAAESDDRSLSSYIRILVKQDLSLRASSMACRCTRDKMGLDRGEEGRNE